MPRKRKTSKRSGADIEEAVHLLLTGDGTVTMFDAQRPLDPFTARALWPELRTAVWREWATYDGLQSPEEAPGGAIAYDGLGDRAQRMRWPVPSPRPPEGVRAHLAEIDAAARSDLDALDRWVAANPGPVAEIVDELALHRLGLLTMIEIATTVDNGADAAAAAHAAWATRWGK